MPKPSFDTLLQRAIEPAVLDRNSLADCYDAGTPERERCASQARSIGALRGRKLKDLSPDERTVAFLALTSAEQWEDGLADANHDRSQYAVQCRTNARLFREIRLGTFGRSVLEVALDGARAVGVVELLHGEAPDGAKQVRPEKQR